MNKEYTYLISLIESHRNEIVKELYSKLGSKKILLKYLKKYDKLLLELYKKYEKDIF